jgi:hypothetical protein
LTSKQEAAEFVPTDGKGSRRWQFLGLSKGLHP